MTTPNGTPGGQVPASGGTQGQVPATSSVTPTVSGQVPAPGANGDDDHLSVDQLRDTVRKLRDDAAKERFDRKRLAELEKAEQDRQTANLSDNEKAAHRAEAAEAALTATRARIGSSELKLAAQTAGIIDPDLAPALLGAKVEYDTDGEPKNIAELVKALKSEKPHLFAAGGGQQPLSVRPASSGGATNPGAGGVGGAGNPPGTWSRTQITRMSDADYIKNRSAIQEAMNKGLLLP